MHCNFLTNKKMKFSTILLLILFLPAILFTTTFSIPSSVLAQTVEIVTFPDPNLETAVREALNKPTGDITSEDMASLTLLDASNRDIVNLTGLEYAINLDRLTLWQNQISDLSPLAGLTKLTKLKLYRNQIVDISPIANLTNLNGLYLEQNQIVDLSPLAGLTGITEMDLAENRISDVSPLANLINLGHLEISRNQITDISAFAALPLNWLEVHENQIADISPLANNMALGLGDFLNLQLNPLNEQAYNIHIPELQQRGVEVLFSPPVGGGCIPLNFGSTTSDAISTLGEEDCYSFNGVIGEAFLARMVRTSGTMQPEIRLYRPDGSTVLCSKSGTSLADMLCLLKNTGTHTLRLGDLNDDETGDYNLYFQRTNNPVNATPLNLSETISGTVSALAEMKTYTFTGAINDRIVINTVKTSGLFQPEVRVYSQNGKLLCYKIGSLISHLLCTVKISGTHTVLAGDNGGNETGDYNLYIQRTNSPMIATPLNLSDTVSGDITVASQMNTYTFTGAIGDRVVTRMVKTSGALAPYVRVYRPDGTLKCSKSGTLISDTLCTLDKDGVHTVLLSDGGSATGSYTFYIQRTNNPVNATPINPGETIALEISMTSEMDSFTFSGVAGTSVVVTMTATSSVFQPEMRVYRPDGTLRCSKKGTSPITLTCLLDVTGTHTILAGDMNGEQTGSYTITF